MSGKPNGLSTPVIEMCTSRSPPAYMLAPSIFMPASTKVSAEFEAIEQLQRAAPHDEGLRLVAGGGRFIDDAALEAVVVERGGHGEADGAGADD